MLTLNCNGTLRAVASLLEAKAAWEAERDRNGWGMSDMRRGCGNVKNEAGKLVARVSYNGRVWSPSGEEVRP